MAWPESGKEMMEGCRAEPEAAASGKEMMDGCRALGEGAGTADEGEEAGEDKGGEDDAEDAGPREEWCALGWGPAGWAGRGCAYSRVLPALEATAGGRREGGGDAGRGAGLGWAAGPVRRGV